MILQPIVENCINHGIREMEGRGKIWLSVYQEDDFVCISVKDNGRGISTENIEKILNGSYRQEKHPGSSNGIGMDNVIARLKLYSEMDDVMSIYSEGEGYGNGVCYIPEEKGRGGTLSCTGSCWLMMKGS